MMVKLGHFGLFRWGFGSESWWDFATVWLLILVGFRQGLGLEIECTYGGILEEKWGHE